jgi:hypothetical protein
LAAQLRALAPVVDAESARAAHEVCAAVRDEARKRAAAADAAAADEAAADTAAADTAAADAAYDAAAAAYDAEADEAAADTAAAAAAYDAAAAAGAGAYYAAARHLIVEATIRAFERVIAIAA